MAKPTSIKPAAAPQVYDVAVGDEMRDSFLE